MRAEDAFVLVVLLGAAVDGAGGAALASFVSSLLPKRYCLSRKESWLVRRAPPSPFKLGRRARVAGVCLSSGLHGGRLVVFQRDENERPTLALLASRNGKNAFLAKDAAGQSCSIASRDVRYVLPLDVGGAAFTEHTVAEFERALQRLACGDGDSSNNDAPAPLQRAWTHLHGDDPTECEPQGPEDVAVLAFGEVTPLTCFLAHSLLEGEHGKLLFTPARSGKYRPRSSTMVDEMVRKRDEAQNEEAFWVSLVGTVQQALRSRNAGSGGGSSGSPNDGGAAKAAGAARTGVQPKLDVVVLPARHQEALQSLMALGARCMDRPTDEPGAPQPAAEELLRRLGRAASRGNAFRLCLQLGLFDVHENLFLFGSDFVQPFSAEALAEAEQLRTDPPPDADAARRRDLRHLKAYAVDSADTKEVDDALSVEVLEDGTERIWVHIADPTRWVAEGGPLYHEALRRQTSLYLPDALVPMLPMPLAEGTLSLRTGGDSCALSLAVDLAADGSIARAELTPSLVRLTYRLTYAELDDMLYEGVADREEAALGRLARLARLRLAYRGGRGAVDRFAPRPPSFFAKTQPNSAAEAGIAVEVVLEDPERRSALLVTEMMVMAGEAVARVAVGAGLGVPFRRQTAPQQFPSDIFLQQFPERYCRSQAACRFMMAAELSSEPGPHAGLGLDGYVQWSSPIRRFKDLLVHYQLKKFLRAAAAAAVAPGDSGGAGATEGGRDVAPDKTDASPLSPGEILERARVGEAVVAAALRLSRGSHRYWLIEYLRRGMTEGREYEAYVLGLQDKRDRGGKVMYSVLLVALGATLSLPQLNAAGLRLGETVLVRVLAANPRALTVALAWRARDAGVGEGPAAAGTVVAAGAAAAATAETAGKTGTGVAAAASSPAPAK